MTGEGSSFERATNDPEVVDLLAQQALLDAEFDASIGLADPGSLNNEAMVIEAQRRAFLTEIDRGKKVEVDFQNPPIRVEGRHDAVVHDFSLRRTIQRILQWTIDDLPK